MGKLWQRHQQQKKKKKKNKNNNTKIHKNASFKDRVLLSSFFIFIFVVRFVVHIFWLDCTSMQNLTLRQDETRRVIQQQDDDDDDDDCNDDDYDV